MLGTRRGRPVGYRVRCRQMVRPLLITIEGAEKGARWYVCPDLKRSDIDVQGVIEHKGGCGHVFVFTPYDSDIMIRVRKAGWLPMEIVTSTGRHSQLTLNVPMQKDAVFTWREDLHPERGRLRKGVISIASRVKKRIMRWHFGSRWLGIGWMDNG